MNILATKNISPNLIDYAKHYNIKITCQEFIKINPLPFNTNIKFDLYEAVIFTSINAIKLFFDTYKRKIPILVVALNQASKTELQKHVTNLKTFANAEQIADFLIQNKFKKVLHICGKNKLDTLKKKCQQHNINYTYFEIYDTILMHHKIKIQDYDGILFFSPSGVKSFFYNNPINNKIKLIIIGNSTHKELKKYNISHAEILIAQQTTPLSMIKCLI